MDIIKSNYHCYCSSFYFYSIFFISDALTSAKNQTSFNTSGIKKNVNEQFYHTCNNVFSLTTLDGPLLLVCREIHSSSSLSCIYHSSNAQQTMRERNGGDVVYLFLHMLMKLVLLPAVVPNSEKIKPTSFKGLGPGKFNL